MSLSSLSFQIEEAAKNIRRNGLMSAAALATVTISMAVLGGALFSLYRLHQFVEAQPRQFEVAVYMKTSAKRASAEDLRGKIAAIPGVESVTLCTREQAFAEMEEKDKESGTGIMTALEANPLPDRLDVRLADPHATIRVANMLSDRAQYPDIDRVRDARKELEMLFGIQRVVRNVGLIAGALLFIATAFVIQNTIRLTVLARRREIRIMQLVGATPGFIQFPLVLEGVFYGAMGAAIASGLVLLSAHEISDYVGRFASPILQTMPPPVKSPMVIGAMAALGAATGWLGSVLSIRRFLKRV